MKFLEKSWVIMKTVYALAFFHVKRRKIFFSW